MKYLFYAISATVAVLCLISAARINELESLTKYLRQRVALLETRREPDPEQIQQLQSQVQDLQNRMGVLEDVKIKIVGGWEMMNMAPQDKSFPAYAFSKDGTVAFWATISGSRVGWSGTYQINGNTIKITKDNNKDEHDLEVKALSDTMLIIRNPSKAENHCLEFKRVTRLVK